LIYFRKIVKVVTRTVSINGLTTVLND